MVSTSPVILSISLAENCRIVYRELKKGFSGCGKILLEVPASSNAKVIVQQVFYSDMLYVAILNL